MSDRFSLLYRFSTDYGLTWTDLTPQVDSRQTSITQNLCTNNFTSAKDEATFVMPETPLYDADGNATPKKALMDALMGDDDILIEINAPGPVDVLWEGDDVLWKGFHVQWRGSVRYFTGYADRSSMNLRSYPLPPRLTVKVQDVSVLHLDDKVNDDILLENKKISEIVSALLTHAGYVSVGSTALDNADDEALEAFVISKDDSKTYRQYIDDLLFEAGGYVLDFNGSGQANVVHLKWDGSASASRTIDNPMNSDGVTLRSAWLKEDGVKVKWSSLAWAYAQRIWQADINQEMGTSGELVGVTVQSGHYWPENGELDPVYMEYDAKLLDSDYLTRASRRENKDLTVIMAKNCSVRMDALQNGSPFTGWTYVDPQSWPVGDNWHDKYGIPTNPTYWPTKAWHLLYNGTGSDVNLTFFSIYGDVLYRNKVNTVLMQGAKNPKEYESTYIYNQAHAERFAQFWWHFLQTSRYQFSWSEPNRHSALNDVVAVGVKGNNSTQKALIAGKTSTWINDNVEIISYTAVGIDAYTPASLVPISVVPSSTKPVVQTVSNAIVADLHTAAVKTLSEWQEYVGLLSTWGVDNVSDFTVGDTAIINGTISDMDNLPITLYISVSEVDSVGQTISGTGIKIEYTPVTQIWDFDLNTLIYSVNKRDTQNSTHIVAKSKVKGYPSASLEWEARDASMAVIATGSGSTFDFYLPLNGSYVSPITVRMEEANGLVSPLEKTIDAIDQTEYDHDFAVWEPLDDGTNIYVLPDHFTVSGVDYDSIKGDYFVSKVTFAPYSSGTAVVSPTGDPSAQGWYERKGSGTNAKPYYWQKTTDTSVVGGKIYGTVGSGNQKFEAGYAYIYSGSSWDGFDITDEASARKAANLLNDLVTGNVQIPESTSNFSMWKWAKNFVAQNAVTNNLFAQAINLLNNGYIRGGERYLDDNTGTMASNAWDKPGFWFGADGRLMANLQSDANNNTFVGTDVANANASVGSYNTAMGYGALHSNASGGDYNVALGDLALYSNTTGDYNIAIGHEALYSSSTNSYNVGIGYQTLYNATSGNYNIGLGYQSLLNLSTGSNNIGIGYQALCSNTTSNNNTALGYQALYSNTAGSLNVAIGNGALYNCTTASSCVALGFNALHNLTTGIFNVALGAQAGKALTSGGYNTAVGQMALGMATTGSFNVALGDSALYTVSTGRYNIGIGNSALPYSGTGYYQVNINDQIIVLSFKKGRRYSDVYTVLKSFFINGQYESIGCMGEFEGQGIQRIGYEDDGDNECICLYGNQYFFLYSSTSTTLNYNARLCFIKPTNLGTGATYDCLS